MNTPKQISPRYCLRWRVRRSSASRLLPSQNVRKWPKAGTYETSLPAKMRSLRTAGLISPTLGGRLAFRLLLHKILNNLNRWAPKWSVEMSFKPQGLPTDLCKELDAFILANSMVNLYKSYSWENDTYTNGFPDIRKLELQLQRSEASTGILISDVKNVAKWGAMRSQGRISGTTVVLQKNTLIAVDGDAQPCLEAQPQEPIDTLKLIVGLGPTYQSKVLRFALPEEYGAIDTRIVRVFGQGDSKAHRHNWLSIKAILGTHKGKATGWSIPATQKHWPSDFARWINILRYMAKNIQDKCPHPKEFEESKLRVDGQWTCADVEMALFSYASKYA